MLHGQLLFLKYFLLFVVRWLQDWMKQTYMYLYTACCLNFTSWLLWNVLLGKLRLRQLVTTEARVVAVRFVVGRVVLEQVSSEQFSFLLPVIFPPLLHTHFSSGAGTISPSGATVSRGWISPHYCNYRVTEKWAYAPFVFDTIVVMVECLIWACTWWLKGSEHRYGDLHCRSRVEFCAMFWQMFCADNLGSREWRLLRELPITLLLCDTAFCRLSP
jgi:hypothetical protein